jgi:hypothetical protein
MLALLFRLNPCVCAQLTEMEMYYLRCKMTSGDLYEVNNKVLRSNDVRPLNCVFVCLFFT